MRRRVLAGFLVLCGALVFGVTTAAAANANAIDGPCFGSGVWENSKLAEQSDKHNQGDTITVPQKDTVHWFGNENGVPLGQDGPVRSISGSVDLDLPIGTVTIDDWKNPPNGSTAYANEGEHKYDLPSFLVGIKMKLHGSHSENGKVVCSGSVYVKVKGSAVSNPLFWAGVALTVIAGGAFFFAGRPVFTKVRPTYDDVH